MRISGIEPSSVILSQTKHSIKLKCDAQITPKQVEAQRNGVKKTQNVNFN